MSAADDFTGSLAVGRAKAQTLATERARIAGCLLVLKEAVGFRATRAVIDAEWTRLVADDPRRAAGEGFVG